MPRALTASKVATPRPLQENAGKGASGASVPSSADPGPPPAYPAPTFGALAADRTLAERLWQAGREAGMDTSLMRQNITNVPVMRAHPSIHHYKAALLEWTRQQDAYDANVRARA